MKRKIYKLKGKVQHYAWGGKTFIANLINFKNEVDKPCAEYWMGAHPSASSMIEFENEQKSLYDVIENNKNETLNESIIQQFNELPYLYKILDVNEMLSIQVHPSKEEAVKGFEREEAEGIAITAPHRNYKDKNHKPEIMIALGEFWLLHGFMSSEKIEQRLLEVKEFNVFIALFRNEGLMALYKMIMDLKQDEVDSVLSELIKRELHNKRLGLLDKSMPGWWACKLFNDRDEIKNIDRGVFSIYLFNIVGLQKGEGIFQAAGVPHAYLEGQNVELMANSDNVLRGGLTPKHIDVPELMKHTLFEPIVPNVLKGDVKNSIEKTFNCPVPDFDISMLQLNAGNSYSSLSISPEILLVMDGACIVNGENVNLSVKKGDAFIVFPNENYNITATGNCELYKAYVGGE